VAEAQSILVRVRKAREYAKGIPNNEKTAAQWALLTDLSGVPLLTRLTLRDTPSRRRRPVFLTQRQLREQRLEKDVGLLAHELWIIPIKIYV
jgi:hypothetical protein